MIIINGWSFHFYDMAAYSRGRCRLLKEGSGCILRDCQDSTSWVQFFDEPEDNYNDKIYQAFMDFQFERKVLNGND
jgi:FPC/CPF motif-containing protein YcgG